MQTNFNMLAKTFFGFEELLENELKQLGAQMWSREIALSIFMETRDLCTSQFMFAHRLENIGPYPRMYTLR